MKKLFRALPLLLAVLLLAGCVQQGPSAEGPQRVEETAPVPDREEAPAPDVVPAPVEEPVKDPVEDSAEEPAETPAPEVEEIPTPDPVVADPEAYVDQVEMEELHMEEEVIALSSSPAAQVDLVLPVAAGTAVEKNSKATLDYSNVQDGYVMVQFTAPTDKRLKAQVAGPSGDKYTYNIAQGVWVTFPLSDGNGEYKIKVYEHTGEGTKYAAVLSKTISVTMANEFAPFLRPNQYVDYAPAVNTVAKAKELTAGITDPLQKVEKVYSFVVGHLTYDRELAASVQSGYLPVLDSVLAGGKGICFDYAALMAGMLRSQGVPCKLVVGYAGTAYHAWISVWTAETGWIDGVIYFDGTTWQRMDPTFASSANGSAAILQYIGDGANYTEKYFY